MVQTLVYTQQGDLVVKSIEKRALTIGSVARLAGVGVETVRFYERQGLIEEPPRRLSGYREYNDEVVSQLGFIRRAKNLGFTLKEIKELFSLRHDPSASATDLRQRAGAKIADIEKKISSLRKMRKALVSLTSACRCRSISTECPLLHALDGEERVNEGGRT
ncbi:MAG: heavy metal-responsive transcriptional regulator [Pirellulales bacterium]|nr:heavy metal-responsive transcriptional regulator [Pirellulales bacterium]